MFGQEQGDNEPTKAARRHGVDVNHSRNWSGLADVSRARAEEDGCFGTTRGISIRKTPAVLTETVTIPRTETTTSFSGTLGLCGEGLSPASGKKNSHAPFLI